MKIPEVKWFILLCIYPNYKPVSTQQPTVNTQPMSTKVSNLYDIFKLLFLFSSDNVEPFPRWNIDGSVIWLFVKFSNFNETIARKGNTKEVATFRYAVLYV